MPPIFGFPVRVDMLRSVFCRRASSGAGRRYNNRSTGRFRRGLRSRSRRPFFVQGEPCLFPPPNCPVTRDQLSSTRPVPSARQTCVSPITGTISTGARTRTKYACRRPMTKEGGSTGGPYVCITCVYHTRFWRLNIPSRIDDLLENGVPKGSLYRTDHNILIRKHVFDQNLVENPVYHKRVSHDPCGGVN